MDDRDRRILDNMPLVRKFAREFVGRGLDWDDLIGEGTIGLIRAVDDYREEKGAKFSTYAGYWIRESIHGALRNRTGTIRIPCYVYTLLGRWRRAERDFYLRTGRTPTFAEIAAESGLTPSQAEAIDLALQARSFAQDGESECHLAPDRGDETDAEYRERSASVHREIEGLEPRERECLALRLAGKTHAAIGREFGITREWARQIEQRAIGKLRARLAPGGGRGRKTCMTLT